MQCRVDGTQLQMMERQGVEIDYCPKCRGVWLDRGELDKIIDRATPAVPLTEPGQPAAAQAAPPAAAPVQAQPAQAQPFPARGATTGARTVTTGTMTAGMTTAIPVAGARAS